MFLHSGYFVCGGGVIPVFPFLCKRRRRTRRISICRVCVCVCACVRACAFPNAHMCACVCVCVFVCNCKAQGYLCLASQPGLSRTETDGHQTTYALDARVLFNTVDENCYTHAVRCVHYLFSSRYFSPTRGRMASCHVATVTVRGDLCVTSHLHTSLKGD